MAIKEEPSRTISVPVVVDESGMFAELQPDLQQAAAIYCRYRADQLGQDREMSPLKARINDLISEVEPHDTFRVELAAPVGEFVALVRQRRSTRKLDFDAAMAILNERGLVKDCVDYVPQINEESVFAALQRGDLTDEEVTAMFPVSVSFSLVPSKK